MTQKSGGGQQANFSRLMVIRKHRINSSPTLREGDPLEKDVRPDIINLLPALGVDSHPLFALSQ